MIVAHFIFSCFVPVVNAQCLLSDVDTIPQSRPDSLVCMNLQSLSCCPYATQESIAKRIAELDGTFGDGGCGFNVRQLMCTALCGIEQALGGRVVQRSNETRVIEFAVDESYAANMYLSCKQRCDASHNTIFAVSKPNPNVLLSLLGGTLEFDDHGVMLHDSYNFVVKNRTHTSALFAVDGASLTRKRCGDDDTPCVKIDFISSLPPCSIPRTVTTQTEPVLSSPTTEQHGESVDSIGVLIVVATTLPVVCMIVIAMCVLFARRMAHDDGKVAGLHLDPMHNLAFEAPRYDDPDDNFVRGPNGHRVKRLASPNNVVAAERRRSAARRRSRQLAGSDMSSDDDAVNSMDSCESEPPIQQCSVCATPVSIDENWPYALSCTYCNAARRGICVYDAKIGREDELFCLKCHKVLPGMLPRTAKDVTNEDCSICLDPFGNAPSRVVELPCSHVLHLNCFVSWFERNPKHNNHCPLCKSKLKMPR